MTCAIRGDITKHRRIIEQESRSDSFENVRGRIGPAFLQAFESETRSVVYNDKNYEIMSFCYTKMHTEIVILVTN